MKPRWLTPLLVVALSVGGCGGKQKVPDGDASADPADLNEISAEALAEAPCGNPDWSKLPEGSDAPEPK